MIIKNVSKTLVSVAAIAVLTAGQGIAAGKALPYKLPMVPATIVGVDGALSVPREEMLASIRANLYPSEAPIPEPSYEIVSKEDKGDYERWYLRYLVDEGEHAVAWLLVPKPLPQRGERLPLVLALHPTNNTGKDRTVGIYESPHADEKDRVKRENRQYALDLVERGFVVFVPDRAAFGERRLLKNDKGEAIDQVRQQMNAYQSELRKTRKGWGMLAKAVWDVQRGIDFLQTMDFIDPERIASVGHSLGAWDSVVLAALDERVKAIVVSHCGGIRYRPAIWADETALRDYLEANVKKGWGINNNLNVFLMLIAPRSQLFFWSVDEPKDGPPNMIEALRTITDFNKKVAKRDNTRADFSFYLHTFGHDFPHESRDLAWRWLEYRMKK